MKTILKILIVGLLAFFPYSMNGDVKKNIGKTVATNIAKKTATSASRGLIRKAGTASGKGLLRKIGLNANEKLARRLTVKQARIGLTQKLNTEGIYSFKHYYSTIIDRSLKSVNKTSTVKSYSSSSVTKFLNKIGIGKDVPKINNIKIERGYLGNTLMKGRMEGSELYKNVVAMQSKGGIRLSTKELTELISNPQYLRKYIETKANNDPMEFLIRLSQEDPSQVRSILAVEKHRKYYAGYIRRANGGKNHEWLMVKNLEDFLTNPKWGDDGAYLAKAMTTLVQKTENVLFKAGGGHGGEFSGRFHNELSKLIADCNNKEELFINIRKFAKLNLTTESYQEFKTAFREALK